MMIIRQEEKKDYKEVFEVVEKAFATALHTDGTEQFLVEKLRKSEAFIPELSLVALIGDRIIGHILFTKVKVGETTQLGLAPLAVLPEYQNHGVGSALIKEGHRIAKEMGYDYSILIGHEAYYPKFGYVPAKTFGITASFEVNDENFMAYSLSGTDKILNGMLVYPKEFGI